MPSTYEILKRDIPELEKEYGSNDPYILQLKRQQTDYENEQGLPLTHPETGEYHAMIVPNPKE